ncbi:MAG: hypothetical protein F4Y07_08630 [Gemmatimonadetes bacterium]|nr:hypothetical protein [Gemmatimonadota bacterium]MYE16531.1 hypothetical protein [Gemmatimonadota bacterium]
MRGRSSPRVPRFWLSSGNGPLGRGNPHEDRLSRTKARPGIGRHRSRCACRLPASFGGNPRTRGASHRRRPGSGRPGGLAPRCGGRPARQRHARRPGGPGARPPRAVGADA